MTQHGCADEEEVDIWESSEGVSVAVPPAEKAGPPVQPPRPCPVLLGFTQEDDECEQRKAEFASEAKYFFNAVQEMKDQGQWQARRNYRRMTQHGVEDEEEMDIWNGSTDASEDEISKPLPVQCVKKMTDTPDKLPKAKFPPRVLLGSEVTQQDAHKRTDICEGRRLEFAEQAQYFFGAVQDMKQKGQWQARQDYKRMTHLGGDEEVVDIWS